MTKLAFRIYGKDGVFRLELLVVHMGENVVHWSVYALEKLLYM